MNAVPLSAPGWPAAGGLGGQFRAIISPSAAHRHLHGFDTIAPPKRSGSPHWRIWTL